QQLFREVYEEFSELIFYDVDIPLTVRYAAAKDVFLMARCEVEAETDGRITSIHALDTPYELDPALPPLRILTLRPDNDPVLKTSRHLIAKFDGSSMRLSFDKPGELITLLNSVLSSFDPDVIQTHFGDSWLFPYLQELSKKTGIPFNP